VLLDKRVALPKVMELTRAASTGVDPGLELPNAGAAVMASEIYEARAMAATRGEYVNVPEIPRSVLSAVIRGRIEDIAGWAQFQLENHTESAIRLRRAVNVLPVESAWWRASMWHLGTALAASGKDAEALEAYIKVYKGGSPDPLRYTAIETVYKRVKGNLDGLETQIGSNPMPPVPEKVIEPGSTEKPDPAQPAPIPSPSPV
jgi:hypothetical protein